MAGKYGVRLPDDFERSHRLRPTNDLGGDLNTTMWWSLDRVQAFLTNTDIHPQLGARQSDPPVERRLAAVINFLVRQ
jgi:hypothetical protein